MLQALLRGKLSSNQENMEDVLTSCVFGCIRYLNPNDGLGLLLKEVRGSGRIGQPFADLRIVSDPMYEFWPSWRDDGLQNCEPDVVIRFVDSNSKSWVVLVEVKYHSGKSAYADDDIDVPTDQLAKEWDHLVVQSLEHSFEPMLIYVTSDVVYPTQDISNAAEEYRKKRRGSSKYRPMRCCWLSWRSLYRIFQDSESTAAADIRSLADRLGFKEFAGFSPIGNIQLAQWRYRVRYNWVGRRTHATAWRYEQ